MKRSVLLFSFLILFLSCGNMTTNSAQFVARPVKSIQELSKEQQLIAEKLDSFFTDMNKMGIFNGSVLVSKAGKILFKKSIGLADKENKRSLSDTSMFQLASVSKVITATAVLILHEKNLLDIEQPFTDFFPDFPYEKVRIKDLLSHRSGLPNYMYTMNTEICRPNYQMNNSDMYTCLVEKKSAPYLNPDRRFNYCNTNYALLANLVEKVSGKSYPEFLRHEIFGPLGMKHTATIYDIDLNSEQTAKPYDNRWRPVGFDASDYVLGDKSIYSTPSDLFLFSEALYNNRIISAQTQELAYTAFSKEQKLNNYGLGWRLKDFKDPVRKEVYHNGWWHGYRSAFHRRLSDTLTVVILSNQLNSATYQTHKVYEIIDNTVNANAANGNYKGKL